MHARLSLTLVVLVGCSTPSPLDGGVDGGVALPDAAVADDAGMTGPGLYDCPADSPPCAPGWYCRCVDAGLPNFADCPAAQAETTFNFCPPGNVYELHRDQCAEGETWTILFSGIGPTLSCHYAGGALVGATNRTDHGFETRWGQIERSNCLPVETCGDAGACSPAPPGACVPLPWFDRSCAPTTDLQRSRLCDGNDAGTWSRSDCSDGGMTWSEARDPLGAHYECTYVDGVRRGAVFTHDAGAMRFAGEWQLQGCVSAPLCP